VTIGSGPTIHLKDFDLKFSKEIRRLAGTDFYTCLQCRSCSGGCPFSEYMDYMPNGVMRLVQLGLKPKRWPATPSGSASAATRAPFNAHGDRYPRGDGCAARAGHCRTCRHLEPDILNFHREVLGSIERYGRTHKLEIMLRYKLKTRDLISDWTVGMKMLAKRKLDLTLPGRADRRHEKIFQE